ncbi:MAG: outer membrane beta-barrel protein [Alphaproteobacteria bacterium]|nr:outer membrane beta-barrel protein [Alphaproteobacteria bacterium]
MKRTHILGLVVAAAMMAPLAAQAENAPGWYVGGGGMAVLQTEADIHTSGITDKIQFDPGWGVSASGGYGWGYGIRTELEAAYRHVGVDKVTGDSSGPTNGGTLHNISFMGNALYDIDTGTIFTPYLGAGLGLSVVGADNIRTVVGTTLDDTKAQFAYQGIAGVAAELDKNWSVTADYRYFRTLEPAFKNELGDHVKTTNASHNIMVGLRYTFGEPEPVMAPAQVAPPVMKPAPVARPIVPTVPQSYMVFFDFDKAVLTPEARRIIASAAEDYKKGHFVRIVVTGHTDTMGTAKYNQKLSERRGEAVKNEFVRLSVPSTEVSVVGVGKAGLLVPTNDQVREAQNRRAEIVFNK